MSAVLTQRPSRPMPAGGRGRVHWNRFAPLGVGLVAAYAALLGTGTPAIPVASYTAYFALAVVVPGTLLHRWVAGFAESLLADVTWGAVTGLVVEFFAWALFTALQINGFLWVWPLLVMATFVAVPRLRRWWRRPLGGPVTPPTLSWGVCAAFMVALAYVTRWYFGSYPLPPSGREYHIDIAFHLGFAATATRTIPLADSGLAYHWFADAHLAAAHLISGVPLTTVILRTWTVPAIFLLVATTGCLGTRLSRRPAVGTTAALLIVATPLGILLWPRLTFYIPALFPLSVSFIFSVGLAALLVRVVADVVRGERIGTGQTLLMAATAIVSIGTKPSVVPEVVGGLGLFVVLRVLRHRTWPSARLVATGGLLLLLLVASIPTVSKSGELGSGIFPFAIIATAGPATTAMVGVVLLADLLANYLLLPSAIVAMRQAGVRRDRGAQLLACVLATGVTASVLVDHPGRSQIYFWLTAAPFAAILTSWGLVEMLTRHHVPRARLLAGVGALTAAAAVCQMYVAQGTPNSAGVGVLLLAGLLVCAAAVARYLRIARGRYGLAVTLTVVAFAASAIPSFFVSSWLTSSAPKGDPHLLAQSQAAMWVAEHVPADAVVATNSHCVGGPTRPHCDASAYWLSGFGQRQVLVGGWAWSLSSHRDNGVNGYSYARQPYSNPGLLALNDGVFTHPRASAVRALYTRYDVRWLVADRYAGPVSETIGRFATRQYTNRWITVFRLDPPGSAP